MKPSTTLQKACQVLRRRVRLDGASIRLDESTFPKDDTDQIRDAMRLYVETWIVPIIDDIETGNTERLARFVDGERGHSIEP